MATQLKNQKKNIMPKTDFDSVVDSSGKTLTTALADKQDANFNILSYVSIDEVISDVSDLYKNRPNIRKNGTSTEQDIVKSLIVGVGCTVTEGTESIATGDDNTASGIDSACIAGCYNEVSGDESACIGGSYHRVSGNDAACIAGYKNEASGADSVCLGGNNNKALQNQVKMGHYATLGGMANSYGTVGDACIIGNGTTSAKSNAFRVSYEGGVYGLSAFKSSGADYAEYFEWTDGNSENEDRRGLFVTLDGERIKPANSGDYILGVVSGDPSVCGDSQSEVWRGMYARDIYGSYIKDVDGSYVLSADYNPEKEYVSREDRPEWAAVGLLGKLVVRDDSSCKVNGYCTVGADGTAVSAETGYRVIARLDDSHVKIIFR